MREGWDQSRVWSDAVGDRPWEESPFVRSPHDGEDGWVLFGKSRRKRLVVCRESKG